MLGLGAAIALGGIAGWSTNLFGLEAVVVGLPLGPAVMIASVVGGGPRAVPEDGYRFEEAMSMLRRVTQATKLVALALAGSAAGPRTMGEPRGWTCWSSPP